MSAMLEQKTKSKATAGHGKHRGGGTLTRRDGRRFRALTQEGARAFLNMKKVDLVDYIDGMYAEEAELANRLAKKTALPLLTYKQLVDAYDANLHRPVADLAERLARHSDFFRDVDREKPDLDDRLALAAMDLGCCSDDYRLRYLAEYFLQMLDYSLERRGLNPESLLQLLAGEIRIRLNRDDW